MKNSILTFIRTVIRYHERRKELLAQRWYRNLSGGLTHPHCMASLSKKELWEIAGEDVRKHEAR